MDNLARADAAGKSEAFITDSVGFLPLPRKERADETSDFCAKAFAALLEKCPEICREDIECLVVVSQNPDGAGLPGTSAIVQTKVGLTEIVAGFDISLACSGFVYALDIMLAFMQAQGMKQGLLFTAEPFSKVLDPTDYDTELLFSDPAAVVYIGEDPVFVTKKSVFCTDGELSHSIKVDEETRILSMLGNNVFKFAVTKVPAQVSKCLACNGLEKDDVDLYLMHQGSKYIIDNLITVLGVNPEKVPFLAAETGNTVSSSIPLMLEPICTSERKEYTDIGFWRWACLGLRQCLQRV